jgi:uncharacterized protein YbjT (DUF2867 family)
MSNADKVILVAGATGQQGGATAKQLLAKGWGVRALTRDPKSPAAQALAAAGAEVVQADLDDATTLAKALQNVYGVFSVQNFWGIGYEGEVRQGVALAEAAKTAGVQHFVYSSVGGAERHSNIPHFESKGRIEQHLASSSLPVTVIRPVFFMENFESFMRPQGDPLTISLALQADKPLQLIAVQDIGAIAALAFEQPEKFVGQSLEIAGDELTLPQIAEVYTRQLNQPVQAVSLPLEQVRSFDPEMAIMFEWFNTSGYQADIKAIRALYPPLLNFESWLKQSSA